MNILTALKNIFQENTEKFFTSEMLKEMIYSQTGHYPREGEFSRNFLELRDKYTWTNGYTICKIPCIKGWHYILTKSERWKMIHNKKIEHQKTTLENRKIKSANNFAHIS